MRLSNGLCASALFILSLSKRSTCTPVTEASVPVEQRSELWEHTESVKRPSSKISPKVFIISMFEPEASVWYGIKEFDIFGQNITIPGLSPYYPQIHCTKNGDVCQVTIGEGEINAASSIMALALSRKFNLTKTYFMVAGIAGINPEVASTCSVTFARFAVQVALQYEFDIRDLPGNYSTGYIPNGVDAPGYYPTAIYGSEVLEFNTALQEIAVNFARSATLSDSVDAIAYRANYASDPMYAAGAAPPAVYACDVATSDVYYSGKLLGESFGNYIKLMTNGTGNYCSTAQEDNATGQALMRAAIFEFVDFSRVIIMRTASDFDRQYPGESAQFNLFYATQGAFLPALENLYLAGIQVVEGILREWDTRFKTGIRAQNYVGDIFGSLGGTPDFGPGGYDINIPTIKRNLGVSRASMVKTSGRPGSKDRMASDDG
ncbi:NUP-domain-containing protein [Venturia nashicola]|uniref:NUP-domain-containing protein n=1 Tax=Venturia nashicola TaxID=86259 RepID=A0A4Z1PG00_9PEZI|nr:NUP-domain-containing protein [Venturia nashicola]TLD32536.1 NUP-domain-containing protein [Venturia nashicola]